MSKTKFIKQAAILAVASLLVRLLGFLYRLPLTNMLGDEGNGIYSAGFYLYNFFLVMSSAGLPAAISKIVSEKVALEEYRNVKKTFKISLILSSTLGLIFALIMFVSARFFCRIISSPDSYYTILTLSPTVFIVSVMSVFRGYFQGLGTTVPTALSQVIEQIFNAIFSIYLAYLLVGISLPLGAAGGTMGTGIGALAGLIYILIVFLNRKRYINRKLAKRTHKYRIETNKEIAIKIIKTAAPIIAGTAIFSMTNLIDMQMVNTRLVASKSFTDSQVTALYGQLTGKYVTLTTLPVSISTALATAVLPSIASSMVQKDIKTVRRKIDVSLRLTMIVSIPAAVGMGVLADEILLLLFPNYSDGGSLLKWGALSIIFLALCQIITGILQGIGKMTTPAKNAFIGSIIKIPINYFLISIPSINVIGAIISTTVCYIIASLLNFRALKQATKIRPDYNGILFRPMIASIVMGVFCYFSYKGAFYISQNNAISTIISIIISMLVYLFILAIIGGFKREDLILLPMGRKLISILERYKLIV
ncbi:polysaccharide biosynthesis protein [uncultured Tyzzerella sp.]|uniref:putative polysaccharide biosynthesis protein n=1 Tax=uncultured Tyzzerella sp. TaxID=2321398 RepID=UPI002942FCDF|nr:polysaccharide biosynthesis protein [uncultured Tyzzerella sp.]